MHKNINYCTKFAVNKTMICFDRQALEELEDQVWKDSRLLYVLYYCFVCSLKNSYVLQDSIERSSKTPLKVPPVFIATNNTVDQSLI